METPIQGSHLQGTRMERCIHDCLACYQECLICIPYCLSLGEKHAEQKHISLMLECSEMCNMSASLMQLKGEFAYEHCQLCAKVCEACEASCRNVDPNDSMMQKCADMCHRCADSCRNMAH